METWERLKITWHKSHVIWGVMPHGSLLPSSQMLLWMTLENSWESCGTGLYFVYILDWKSAQSLTGLSCISRDITYISTSVCTVWNSFLCVLINSPSRVSESKATHGIPLGWFSFPCLRKGKIFFFIITDLIVIFKLFLSSLPLSHCFSSFHSCFLFISFFLSPSCFFFVFFRSVFSKARERRFVSSSRVVCKSMTLL